MIKEHGDLVFDTAIIQSAGGAAGQFYIELMKHPENKDLIDVGMYQPGTNPKLDIAIEMMPQINAFLQQRTTDSVNMQNTIDTLVNMMSGVDI